MRQLTVLLWSLLLLTGTAYAQSGGPPDGTSCEDHPDADGCHARGGGNETADPDHNETADGNHTEDGNASADRGAHGRDRAPAAAACRHAEDREACLEETCDEHPDARDCRAYDKVRAYCGEDRAHCDAAAVSPRAAYAWCRAHADDRRCDALSDLARLHDGLRHVSFDVDRENKTLLDYSVDGRLLLEAIEYSDDEAEWEVDRRGTQMRFSTDDARFVIHDNPTATLWYRSDSNASLFLMLPADANVTFGDGNATVEYDGYRALIVGEDIEAYDGGILLFGQAGFHAPPVSPPGDAVRAAMDHAYGRGHLGASVDVRGRDANVTSYDEIDVDVSMPQVINVTDALRVVVDANLTEGRTIVIDIDRARLAGPDLVVRYFDVHDDGNETEIVIREADSLADVMDPTDDGGQPEYWIVEDADGVHLMVSVPEWSVHAIELASIGEFLVQPSVLVGIVAGIGGVAVAGLAVFWPRREEEY